jgi:hypothetical protein
VAAAWWRNVNLHVDCAMRLVSLPPRFRTRFGRGVPYSRHCTTAAVGANPTVHINQLHLTSKRPYTGWRVARMPCDLYRRSSISRTSEGTENVGNISVVAVGREASEDRVKIDLQ